MYTLGARLVRQRSVWRRRSKVFRFFTFGVVQRYGQQVGARSRRLRAPVRRFRFSRVPDGAGSWVKRVRRTLEQKFSASLADTTLRTSTTRGVGRSSFECSTRRDRIRLWIEIVFGPFPFLKIDFLIITHRTNVSSRLRVIELTGRRQAACTYPARPKADGNVTVGRRFL